MFKILYIESKRVYACTNMYREGLDMFMEERQKEILQRTHGGDIAIESVPLRPSAIYHPEALSVTAGMGSTITVCP